MLAGLNAIEVVTELRAAHACSTDGSCGAGVNVRRGRVTDMRQENVLQPLHVTASALGFATETVRAILKIDDIVSTHKITITSAIYKKFHIASDSHSQEIANSTSSHG